MNNFTDDHLAYRSNGSSRNKIYWNVDRTVFFVFLQNDRMIEFTWENNAPIVKIQDQKRKALQIRSENLPRELFKIDSLYKLVAFVKDAGIFLRKLGNQEFKLDIHGGLRGGLNHLEEAAAVHHKIVVELGAPQLSKESERISEESDSHLKQFLISHGIVAVHVEGIGLDSLINTLFQHGLGCYLSPLVDNLDSIRRVVCDDGKNNLENAMLVLKHLKHRHKVSLAVTFIRSNSEGKPVIAARVLAEKNIQHNVVVWDQENRYVALVPLKEHSEQQFISNVPSNLSSSSSGMHFGYAGYHSLSRSSSLIPRDSSSSCVLSTIRSSHNEETPYQGALRRLEESIATIANPLVYDELILFLRDSIRTAVFETIKGFDTVFSSLMIPIETRNCIEELSRCWVEECGPLYGGDLEKKIKKIKQDLEALPGRIRRNRFPVWKALQTFLELPEVRYLSNEWVAEMLEQIISMRISRSQLILTLSEAIPAKLSESGCNFQSFHARRDLNTLISQVVNQVPVEHSLLGTLEQVKIYNHRNEKFTIDIKFFGDISDSPKISPDSYTVEEHSQHHVKRFALFREGTPTPAYVISIQERRGNKGQVVVVENYSDALQMILSLEDLLKYQAVIAIKMSADAIEEVESENQLIQTLASCIDGGSTTSSSIPSEEGLSYQEHADAESAVYDFRGLEGDFEAQTKRLRRLSNRLIESKRKPVKVVFEYCQILTEELLIPFVHLELEELQLIGCSGIITLERILSSAPYLKRLSLHSCSNLESISKAKQGASQLDCFFLQDLSVRNCEKIKKIAVLTYALNTLEICDNPRLRIINLDFPSPLLKRNIRDNRSLNLTEDKLEDIFDSTCKRLNPDNQQIGSVFRNNPKLIDVTLDIGEMSDHFASALAMAIKRNTYLRSMKLIVSELSNKAERSIRVATYRNRLISSKNVLFQFRSRRQSPPTSSSSIPPEPSSVPLRPYSIPPSFSYTTPDYSYNGINTPPPVYLHHRIREQEDRIKELGRATMFSNLFQSSSISSSLSNLLSPAVQTLRPSIFKPFSSLLDVYKDGGIS